LSIQDIQLNDNFSRFIVSSFLRLSHPYLVFFGLFGLSYARDGMIGDETLIEKDIAAIFVNCFRSRAS